VRCTRIRPGLTTGTALRAEAKTETNEGRAPEGFPSRTEGMRSGVGGARQGSRVRSWLPCSRSEAFLDDLEGAGLSSRSAGRRLSFQVRDMTGRGPRTTADLTVSICALILWCHRPREPGAPICWPGGHRDRKTPRLADWTRGPLVVPEVNAPARLDPKAHRRQTRTCHHHGWPCGHPSQFPRCGTAGSGGLAQISGHVWGSGMPGGTAEGQLAQGRRWGAADPNLQR